MWQLVWQSVKAIRSRQVLPRKETTGITGWWSRSIGNVEIDRIDRTSLVLNIADVNPLGLASPGQEENAFRRDETVSVTTASNHEDDDDDIKVVRQRGSSAKQEKWEGEEEEEEKATNNPRASSIRIRYSRASTRYKTRRWIIPDSIKLKASFLFFTFAPFRGQLALYFGSHAWS